MTKKLANAIPASKSKVCCLNCKSEVTLINLNRHYLGKSCLLGYKFSTIPRSSKEEQDCICQFCNKKFTKVSSVISHERFCKLNPNREIPPFELNGFHEKLRSENKLHNQYTKAESLGLPKPTVSEETLQKLSISASNRVWSEEQKQNHSKIMLKVAKEKPDSYSAGNQGRCKTYEIDGIKLKGSWEVKYYLYCKENKIKTERPTVGFTYFWEGKNRTYYPDFYHSDHNTYVEIKGYETERDQAKWNKFPETLLIFKEKEIKQIEKGVFNLNDFL